MDDFFKNIIIKEIDGKNQAIHEYDKMLWALRTGFLTLFFAGWGLLLAPFAEQKPIPDNQLIDINTLLLVMASISLTICIGGFLIDLNYIRRKYRVIHSLDLLYKRIFSQEKLNELKTEQFLDLIQVSGSKANKNYIKTSGGYSREKIVTYLIYLMPIISMIVGIVLLWQ
jgi:hypothetical protein